MCDESTNMHEAMLNLHSSPLSFLCIHTEPFVVGFAETMYTVSEGNGQVEVCVNLTSPEEDIGDEVVLVEVFSNTNPGSILTSSTLASKLNKLCSRKPCIVYLKNVIIIIREKNVHNYVSTSIFYILFLQLQILSMQLVTI